MESEIAIVCAFFPFMAINVGEESRTVTSPKARLVTWRCVGLV